MKKIYFWLIGAGVIILILGGFLYYRYHKSKNNSSSTSTQTVTTTNTSSSQKTKAVDQTAVNSKAVSDSNFQAAETAYQQKDYATAANLIAQEVGVNPTAVGYNLWGNILRDSGDNATAKAKYEQAINLDASYISAYINLATIYQDEGNIDKAKEILNQGLTANPDNTDLQNSLAILEITPTTGN
jgi:tetratricopeptide (TPR) repeat protein